MKIINAQVFSVEPPYSGGVYRLSGGREYRSFTSLIVRLETNTGLVGWGDPAPWQHLYRRPWGRNCGGPAPPHPRPYGLRPPPARSYL